MTGPLILALVCAAIAVVRLRRAGAAASAARRLFDAAPVATLLLDEADRIAQANGAAALLAGCDADGLAGRRIAELVHADDLALLRIALAQLRHDVCAQLGTEVRLLRGGGAPVTVSLHAAPVAVGHARRTLVQLLDVTERKRTEARLREMADHDALTGLLNRRCFARELERHAAHSRRYGAEGAVIVLDVDRFKQVNDTEGHGAGDRLLVQLAEILHGRLRGTDVLARLGGDEFAILLPRADRAAAEAVARSLVDTVRSTTAAAGGSPMTISVGVAMAQEYVAMAPEALVAAADCAMYAAKQASGDTHAFADAPLGAPVAIAA